MATPSLLRGCRSSCPRKLFRLFSSANLKKKISRSGATRHIEPFGPKPKNELGPARAEVYTKSNFMGRAVYLNRWEHSNILTIGMVRTVRRSLEAIDFAHWARGAILRASVHADAFCSGTDFIALYENGKKRTQYTREWFHEFYNLVDEIPRIKTPLFVCTQGYTTASGLGLVVHSLYNFCAEDSVMSFNDAAWGWFPDAGMSYILPRLDGHLGMYLALTGDSVKGYDCCRAGLAQLFCSRDNINSLESLLYNLGQFSAELPPEFAQDIHGQSVLDSDLNTPWNLAPHLDAIDRCFGKNSVEEIFRALEAENSEWAKNTLEKLHRASPVSLKVIFRQLQQGAKMQMNDTLCMDYVISQRLLKNSDFYTGVEHFLLSDSAKNNSTPKWSRGSIGEVSDAEVDSYFRLDTDEKPLWLRSKYPREYPQHIPAYER